MRHPRPPGPVWAGKDLEITPPWNFRSGTYRETNWTSSCLHAHSWYFINKNQNQKRLENLMRPPSRRSCSETAKGWGTRGWREKRFPDVLYGTESAGRRVREERVPFCARGPGPGASPPWGTNAHPYSALHVSLRLSPDLPRDPQGYGRLLLKPEQRAACPPGGAAEPTRAGRRKGTQAGAQTAGWVVILPP